MKTIYSVLAFLPAMFLAGCNNDEPINSPDEDEGVMKISAVYPTVASRASDSGFDSGDKIGIYVTEYNDETASPLQISGNWANNVGATFDGSSSWATDKKIYWSDNTVDVYGYYPYMTPTSIDNHSWSVALDQSTAATDDQLSGYEASDFLWAKTSGCTQSNETVALEFKHSCSKLIVQLVKGSNYVGDFPEVAELYIHNVVAEARIDFTTGAVFKDTYADPTTIKARMVEPGRFEAIIVPQRIDSRRPFLELVSGGISYLVEDTFNFKAGVQHTISYTISTSPEQLEIEIDGEVTGGEW